MFVIPNISDFLFLVCFFFKRCFLGTGERTGDWKWTHICRQNAKWSERSSMLNVAACTVTVAMPTWETTIKNWSFLSPELENWCWTDKAWYLTGLCSCQEWWQEWLQELDLNLKRGIFWLSHTIFLPTAHHKCFHLNL